MQESKEESKLNSELREQSHQRPDEAPPVQGCVRYVHPLNDDTRGLQILNLTNPVDIGVMNLKITVTNPLEGSVSTPFDVSHDGVSCDGASSAPTAPGAASGSLFSSTAGGAAAAGRSVDAEPPRDLPGGADLTDMPALEDASDDEAPAKEAVI